MATLRLCELVALPADAPVTLDVPAGATVALAAPPRVGTALARVVVGLAAPAAGAVLVGGRDVTDLPPLRRRIGYVPAGGALLPHLTVRRNIAYGQRKRERVREVADTWAATVVERLELAPTLDLRPHLLSEGQRFRVALARAMACLPEVLVIDLPAGAPDGGRLTDLVGRLSPPDAPGLAVLVCTADEAVLAELANQVPVAPADLAAEAGR
ncbi:MULTISPECIES: ATP-binding cassette domain-containing protein [Micromonospora]|uniref:ATP-binding cassette domain-containing protein n=1 Tax=Micromonospora TaxID=1873 RepID=UPI0013050951|nr:ATP-binding cassette domain-containing protein [Micromonospora sp. S4605]